MKSDLYPMRFDRPINRKSPVVVGWQYRMQRPAGGLVWVEHFTVSSELIADEAGRAYIAQKLRAKRKAMADAVASERQRVADGEPQAVRTRLVAP